MILFLGYGLPYYARSECGLFDQDLTALTAIYFCCRFLPISDGCLEKGVHCLYFQNKHDEGQQLKELCQMFLNQGFVLSKVLSVLAEDSQQQNNNNNNNNNKTGLVLQSLTWLIFCFK